MEGLADVKKELEAKRQALALELESALGQVASIENDLQRVDDALRALTKKSRGRGRGRKSAPALEGEAAPAHAHEGDGLVGGGTFAPGTTPGARFAFGDTGSGPGLAGDPEHHSG